MRIYVNKNKKMIIVPDYNDKYGGISNMTIQILNGKLVREIEGRIADAMNSIIEEYEPMFDSPVIDELFEEKQQAIRKMIDYDVALTDILEDTNDENN